MDEKFCLGPDVKSRQHLKFMARIMRTVTRAFKCMMICIIASDGELHINFQNVNQAYAQTKTTSDDDMLVTMKIKSEQSR